MATSPSSSSLPAYKQNFLNACTSSSCITFGTYTLKSGRISPYFFNIGVLHRAALLTPLSQAFAETIASTDLDFSIIYGPAYKGIPIACTTLEKLATLDIERFGHISYSFNRKEAKTHGDGGNIVGAPLKGKRVLIVDDVITAGTAIRESVDIIAKEGGILVGVVLAVDRQEKTPPKDGEREEDPRLSAVGGVRAQYNIPVLAVLTLDDIIEGSKGIGTEDDIRRLEAYKAKYRACD